MNQNKTKIIILIGIMGAISFVLQLLEFPHIGFLAFEFSDLPSAVIAASFGPLPGVATELVKNLLKALTTKTGFVGELANFIIGSAFVIPIGILFRKAKDSSKISYFKICSASTISMTLVGAIANYFVLIPFFSKFVGGEEKIIRGIEKIIPIVKSKLDLVLFYVTPFNIVKGIIISILALILIRIKFKHIDRQ